MCQIDSTGIRLDKLVLNLEYINGLVQSLAKLQTHRDVISISISCVSGEQPNTIWVASKSRRNTKRDGYRLWTASCTVVKLDPGDNCYVTYTFQGVETCKIFIIAIPGSHNFLAIGFNPVPVNERESMLEL